MKTLGVLWGATTDVFTFKSQHVIDKFVPTKRMFLKGIATLFDPLGFLSPVVVRAKILMEEAWICGLDWDDILLEELSTKMILWFEELQELPHIKIPRCLQLKLEVDSISIHVFVDASEMAYGAVVYLRTEYKDGKVSTSFVISKALLQSTSIPRLELMGAVLGKRI